MNLMTPTLSRLKTIFNRYKLTLQVFNKDDLEIGGGNNIKLLKLYYLYSPFIIGSSIIIIGFLFDFVLFKFCGIPFLLYVVYGFGQTNNAIKNNLNTTIISNDEIRISMNDVVSTLNSKYIKNYEIKLERLDDELYKGQLQIKDTENRKYILLTFIDNNESILNDNLNFINQFIQTKMITLQPAEI